MTSQEKISAVWVYWAGGAIADELRYSMRSVYQHFTDLQNIVLCGDKPQPDAETSENTSAAKPAVNRYTYVPGMRPSNPFIVIGTRPEAIKLYPLVLELKKRGVEPIVCCTGQHNRMVAEILDEFSIRPTYSLCGRTLAESITAVGNAVSQSGTDVVIVQGDTRSSVAGAIAAFDLNVPVAHVEAGLRTYDVSSPRPEEFNRRVITLAAGLHFAATLTAADNLRREGVPGACTFVTGNTGIDALLAVASDANPDGTVLVTAHRRENQGAGLLRICQAVSTLAMAHPNKQFVWPVHPNPAVADTVKAHSFPDNVEIVPALSYQATVRTMCRCEAVFTDSGGLCEEAVTLGVPTVILRDKTERYEAVDAGLATIAGTQTDLIVQQGTDAIAAPANPRSKIFGDGHASARIVDGLLDYFRDRE